jgi:hypothetical protein
MTAPSTFPQVLSVFAAYNPDIWPVQILVYIAGLVAVCVLWTRRRRTALVILLALVVMWVANGVGYHFLFYSRT